MELTRTIKRLLAASVVATSFMIASSAAPAGAEEQQLDPGVCGSGHVGPVGWPGDTCTSCSGIASGPHSVGTLVKVYVCARV